MKQRGPISNENLIFAQLLQKAGYRTAVAGKWQLPGYPPEYGFDEYQLWATSATIPRDVDHKGVESFDPDKYNYMKPARFWWPCIIRNGDYVETTNDEYGPDMHADFLIDFMTRKSDQPFLAYYPMVLTHDPFYATPKTVESDKDKNGVSSRDKNGKANVEYVDHLIGRIQNELEEAGLLENTAIIVTADNGSCCGDGSGRGCCELGKGWAKEIGVREPLYVYWPGHIENQGVKRELIDFSDIFPTLADIADVDIPEDYVHDGRSFLPLLTGKPYEEREFIFSYLDQRRLVRDRRWLLEGDGKFFDCGESRQARGYRGYTEVTDSTDPEVLEAKARFAAFLSDKPAPNYFIPSIHKR